MTRSLKPKKKAKKKTQKKWQSPKLINLAEIAFNSPRTEIYAQYLPGGSTGSVTHVMNSMYTTHCELD